MSTPRIAPTCACPSAADRAAQHAASKCGASTDAGLVRRFNGGDETTCIEIIHRQERKIFATVLGLPRDRADAEEITQDTFLRAHRGLGCFRGDCSLATWLRSIAVNLPRNRYWYYFRRRRHATLWLDCPLVDGKEFKLVYDSGGGKMVKNIPVSPPAIAPSSRSPTTRCCNLRAGPVSSKTTIPPSAASPRPWIWNGPRMGSPANSSLCRRGRRPCSRARISTCWRPTGYKNAVPGLSAAEASARRSRRPGARHQERGVHRAV